MLQQVRLETFDAPSVSKGVKIASGGLGFVCVAAIPAMYWLGLLSDEPRKDIGKLIALILCAAFFGVFSVIPLRKYYVVHQKLTFPTPASTVMFSCQRYREAC